LNQQFPPNTVSTDKLIEMIKEFERNEKKRNLRWLDSNSNIQTTKQIANRETHKQDIPSSSIEIRRKRKLQLIFWIAMLAALTTPVIYTIVSEFNKPDRNTLGMIVISCGALLLYFVGYKNLTLKQFTNPILLTKQGITINNHYFLWKDIENTFFVTRRPTENFFVIGEKNGLFHYFDIDNQLEFNYSHSKFSMLVEHFRTSNLGSLD